MTSTKTRGRPKGTVIPTDQKALDAVADLMLRSPKLRPTAAIKRVAPEWTETIVHRLLGKWRIGKEALLDKARQRETDLRSAESSVRSPGLVCLLSDIRRLQNDPALRTAREIANSPAIRMAREFANSPAMRLAHEIHNSPTVLMMRELQNSPTMLAIRAKRDSPIIRIARVQEMLARRSTGL